MVPGWDPASLQWQGKARDREAQLQRAERQCKAWLQVRALQADHLSLYPSSDTS